MIIGSLISLWRLAQRWRRRRGPVRTMNLRAYDAMLRDVYRPDDIEAISSAEHPMFRAVRKVKI